MSLDSKEEREAMSEESRKKSDRRFWMILGIVIVLLIGVRVFVLDWIWISGESMLPTLEDGELVLAEKLTKDNLAGGDIAIVRYPDGMQCVKRIMGTAGDAIEIRDSQLILNGKIIEEPYVKEQEFGDMGQVIVPENTVFVMGDNRNNSLDSREPTVGPIPRENIVGKVVAVIWPMDSWRGIG